MKKLIALFLVITFIVMNCAPYKRGKGINLEPGQKPGVKLVIQKTDGYQVGGELIAVKEESLLLLGSESGVDVSIDIADIRTIRIVRGFGSGFRLYAGLAAGHVLLSAAEGSLEGGTSIENVSIKVLVWSLLCGLIGGGISSADKIIQFEGKSDSEIQEILEKLRKRARVQNFQ